MIKLIVFDMDGTLLNSKKELPHDFFEVIEKLKTFGIKFGIGSGRQYQTLYKQMGEHANQLIYFSDNGTLVYEGQENVYKDIIDSDLATQAIKRCKELQCFFNIATPNGAVIEQWLPELIVKEFQRYYVKQIWVDDYLDTQECCKISIFDPKADYQLIHEFKELSNVLQIVQSGPEWIDITRQGVNKGCAINNYQQLNNIHQDETMVFGDAMNDYEMMQQATYSFAMENAQPEIKAVSNFETLSNDEDGVMVVLRKLLDHKGDPSCFIR